MSLTRKVVFDSSRVRRMDPERKTPHRVNITDLLLPLDDTSGIPLYRQVYEGLRDAIIEGRLPPGARIPSTRRLAEYLAVSRTTVLVAFEQLAAEGFLVGAVGSGSRVSDQLPPAPPLPEADPRAATISVTVEISRRGRSLLELPRPSRQLSPDRRRSAQDNRRSTASRWRSGGGSRHAATAPSRAPTSITARRKGSASSVKPS